MDQRHPHIDALYRIVIQPDQTFGVEVKNPTIATHFATAADAEAWIAAHKERVSENAPQVPSRVDELAKRWRGQGYLDRTVGPP